MGGVPAPFELKLKKGGLSRKGMGLPTHIPAWGGRPCHGITGSPTFGTRRCAATFRAEPSHQSGAAHLGHSPKRRTVIISSGWRGRWHSVAIHTTSGRSGRCAFCPTPHSTNDRGADGALLALICLAEPD